MLLRVGYDITYGCPQPTPMVLMLNVHYSRVSDLVLPDHLHVTPSVPVQVYRDMFGNWCSRIVAPAGLTRLRAEGRIFDAGLPDPSSPFARQIPVEQLPDDALIFLLGSRYCETDRLSDTAWSRFGHIPPGWAASRRSSTSPTVTSRSATPTPARRAPRGTRTRSRSACAAILPIWPSPCAGA